MLLGCRGADGAPGCADDAGGLAVEGVLAVGARRPVDGILEHAGDRAVVLGRDDQHAVGGLDLAFERA